MAVEGMPAVAVMQRPGPFMACMGHMHVTVHVPQVIAATEEAFTPHQSRTGRLIVISIQWRCAS